MSKIRVYQHVSRAHENALPGVPAAMMPSCHFIGANRAASSGGMLQASASCNSCLKVVKRFRRELVGEHVNIPYDHTIRSLVLLFVETAGRLSVDLDFRSRAELSREIAENWAAIRF